MLVWSRVGEGICTECRQGHECGQRRLGYFNHCRYAICVEMVVQLAEIKERWCILSDDGRRCGLWRRIGVKVKGEMRDERELLMSGGDDGRWRARRRQWSRCYGHPINGKHITCLSFEHSLPMSVRRTFANDSAARFCRSNIRARVCLSIARGHH